MVFAFNTVKNYLAVGYPAGNRVTLMGYVAPAPTITATAGLHGVVAPSGMVTVALGCSTSFVVTADAYYHIASLLTNGASVNAATNLAVYTLVWANVTATGTLSAAFAPDLTTNTGTPHWWLAQYGLMNFEVDAISDPDGDGLPTWQEYLLGTCPTNAYTAGNQFNDGVLVAAGADPLRNDSQNFAAILNHPELFGLYTTNSVQDLSLGGLMIAVVSNNAHLQLNMQSTDDLVGNVWSNAGPTVEWQYPATTNKAFFRVRATPSP
jgi:hypothetical protein